MVHSLFVPSTMATVPVGAAGEPGVTVTLNTAVCSCPSTTLDGLTESDVSDCDVAAAHGDRVGVITRDVYLFGRSVDRRAKRAAAREDRADDALGHTAVDRHGAAAFVGDVDIVVDRVDSGAVGA